MVYTVCFIFCLFVLYYTVCFILFYKVVQNTEIYKNINKKRKLN